MMKRFVIICFFKTINKVFSIVFTEICSHGYENMENNR